MMYRREGGRAECRLLCDGLAGSLVLESNGASRGEMKENQRAGRDQPHAHMLRYKLQLPWRARKVRSTRSSPPRAGRERVELQAR